jgi:hypothetical protein
MIMSFKKKLSIFQKKKLVRYPKLEKEKIEIMFYAQTDSMKESSKNMEEIRLRCHLILNKEIIPYSLQDVGKKIDPFTVTSTG